MISKKNQKHLTLACTAVIASLIGYTSTSAHANTPIKFEIEQRKNHLVQLGKITLNNKTREISFEAKLGNPESVLEYLLVTEKGKTHETLLETDISPTNLNVAMILMKYVASDDLFGDFAAKAKHADVKKAELENRKREARFDIFIEWNEGNRRVSRQVSELIHNAKTNKEAAHKPYVYCGSFLNQGILKAESTGDLIAIFTDKGTIANASNKGRKDDTIWFPNKIKLPKQGTPLTIVIRKHKP